MSDAPKKNCSIIQRICATHSIKLTDPLKSRIKSVAFKSSEHQHERDIQMMGSDKSSGLYQLRKAGKEFPLKCRVREKINLPNICYVFANSTFVAKKALYKIPKSATLIVGLKMPPPPPLGLEGED